MEIFELIRLAKAFGFTNAAPLQMTSLSFLPEVRDMCAANLCGNYGKSWSCPPACGTLEEIRAKAAVYHQGIIVQTTAALEDSYDYDGMMTAGMQHNQSFLNLAGELSTGGADFLPMGAGGCRLCDACTYPDAPCRHPGQRITSMEAYGLVVSEVCAASGIPYYYGPNTITYVSCILF